MSIFIKILIGLAALYVIICLIAYIYQEKLIFLPQKLPDDYKFTFQDRFEEVFLENNQYGKAKIHALHFIANNPKGVILYIHGNAGSLAGWGDVAQDLVAMDYDVFMPDFRGYGKSTGKISQKGLFSDARLTYDYLLGHYQADDITIFGRSLGTGIGAQLASQVTSKQLILETPYFSLTEIGQSMLPLLPISLLNRYPMPSNEYLQAVDEPIHIFHGLKDELVPYASGEKLYRSLGNKNITLITIPKGSHNDLSMFPEYWEQMKNILSR